MDKTVKIIISLIVTVLAAAAFYYGSYEPLRKSQLYINAIRGYETTKPRSIEEFNNSFTPALDAPSPIGYDEITGAYLGVVSGVLNQQNNPQVIEVLVKQVEDRMAPILAVMRGINFSQNLFVLAQINKTAAFKLKSENYYQRSVYLLNEGFKFSPNRPIYLYNLLDLYLARGDSEHAKEIGEIILKYWPEDKKVAKLLGY